MTTYAYGAKGGSTPLGLQSNSVPQVVIYEFDTAKAVAGTLGTGGTAMVSGDIMKIMIIPAGTALISIFATVETALSWTGSPRLDIGDNTSASTYVSNYTTVTAGAVTMSATKGKYYDSADFISLSMAGSTLTSGIIRVIMVFVNATANAATTFIGNVT